jgi:predicted transcriptional regulator
MARKRSAALTEGELRIMNVLWDKGQATVGDVIDALPGPHRPAYNTVLTMLGILERKGHVTHEKAGRAFTYSPLIERQTARRRALVSLLGRFFNGSPELLVLDLLQHDDLDQDELRRIRELLGQAATTTSSSARPRDRR